MLHPFAFMDPSGRLNVYQQVEGVECITASALDYVALAGPTLFGQVVNTVAEIASCSISYNSSKYFVLLIITDGVVTDLQELKMLWWTDNGCSGSVGRVTWSVLDLHAE
ncbi:hypothetical protein RHMOL_Rhmol13G0227300 [Rhododendron molle]|uniref:Uncharacterized protein n=1 Tax=Rhododendron molle TaxID=49168 RepID=A0ACC0LB81_RHOML|nr:hypothetical protein RHMOL_Rhmol13G0227300 [Rhododendron molle]